MYVNLPDLLGDDGLYSDSRYESFYFHVNWLTLICCAAGIINWVRLLVKSHIPWWKSMTANSVKVPVANFGPGMNFGAQGQIYNANQNQMAAQVHNHEYGQQPPRF